MRIGIVADIHDAVEPLRVALRRFRELGVDQVVTLGDAFETIEPGSPGAQVGRVLAGDGAIGVWGNHDVGDGVAESVEDASRSFRAVPERILFVGHFHMWRLIRPGGPVAWDADRPITLEGPERCLGLVSAVVEGWCAVFDADTNGLIPVRCPA